MHLTPKEIDHLMLLSLGDIAGRRLRRGLKLNYPEAVAFITTAALEGAREGKTVEQVMTDAATVLTRNDVMEGVPEMINLLQVEAVFTIDRMPSLTSQKSILKSTFCSISSGSLSSILSLRQRVSTATGRYAF